MLVITRGYNLDSPRLVKRPSQPSVSVSPGNKGPSCHFKPENLLARADDDDDDDDGGGGGGGTNHPVKQT